MRRLRRMRRLRAGRPVTRP
ncbi:hypothetical protein [Streptomyces cyaneofuscatus]